MKSILSFLSALLAFGTGCQPNAVAPPAAGPPARSADAEPAAVAIWVAVDDPGELRSPAEIFQMAAQTVVPNLKKLPGALDVQILGSEKQLASWHEIPAALIRVNLPSK